MKQFTVISGKGGTGKTTLAAAFASLAEDAVIADCDVDAANMHLILKPEILKAEDYFGLKVARINPEMCIKCGLCREFCRYEGVNENYEIDPYNCEGCAVCTIVCSEKAVFMVEKISGQVFSSETRIGPMSHAKLYMGEEASGKLINAVRSNAKKLSEEYSKSLIIIDGPPGTGCSVIAAITGVDLVVIVSEPTVSGIHDLKRVLELAGHFRIPTVVCINKCDINEEKTRLIEEYCTSIGISILCRLPYDEITTEAMLQGKTIIEYAENNASVNQCNFVSQVRGIWTKIEEKLSDNQDGQAGKETLQIRKY